MLGKGLFLFFMEMHSCGAMGSCSLLSTSERRTVQEYTIFTSRLSQTMWNLTVCHEKTVLLSRNRHALVLSQVRSAKPWEHEGRGSVKAYKRQGPNDQRPIASGWGCIMRRLAISEISTCHWKQWGEKASPGTPVAGRLPGKVPTVWVEHTRKCLLKQTEGKLGVTSLGGRLGEPCHGLWECR